MCLFPPNTTTTSTIQRERDPLCPIIYKHVRILTKLDLSSIIHFRGITLDYTRDTYFYSCLVIFLVVDLAVRASLPFAEAGSCSRTFHSRYTRADQVNDTVSVQWGCFTGET